MRIDARGKPCPLPVSMTEDALAQIEERNIEVVVDNEESALNVAGFAAQKGLITETSKDGNDWKVKIYQKNSSQAQILSTDAVCEPQGKQKSILIVVGSDSLGKDEELGKKLIKGFFDTMKVYKELPHTIFFLNAGVKLTTVNNETIDVLKEIESIGVEIYSCGTCLKYYNLEPDLKVGYRGTTNQIIEGMQDFDKVIWL